MRYCARCGFPLAGVAELMANGGLIPQYQPPSEPATRKVSPRRKGVQQGVALIFLAAVLTPLLAVLNAYFIIPEVFFALSAVIGFIGGALRVIYALLFEEAAPKQVAYINPGLQQQGLPVYSQPAPQAVADANRPRTLQPPQQTAPPVSQWRRPDTAEVVRPPSVTENTTKLLDKQEQEEPPAR